MLAWLVLLATLVVAAWRRADPGGRGAAVAVAVLLPLLLLDHYAWTQPPGRIWLVLALAVIPALHRSVRRSADRAARALR